MPLDRKEDLNCLIELLETQEAVTWEDVTELLQGFPSWLRMIESMRSTVPIRTQNFYRPMGFVTLSRETVEQFIRVWKPYATLLSWYQSPMECVRLLDKLEGIEAKSFCQVCLQDQQKEIAFAAESVLQFLKENGDLLRPSGSPDREELLRAVADPSRPDNLLLPIETAEERQNLLEESKKPGWFSRIFRRL